MSNQLACDVMGGEGSASIPPSAAVATSTDGTGVDLTGYGSALCILIVGAWTDGTHTFAIEDSDDDSSYAAVSSQYLHGPTMAVVSSAANDGKTYQWIYTGGKRYLRWTVTVEGSPSTGATCACTIIRCDAKYR